MFIIVLLLFHGQDREHFTKHLLALLFDTLLPHVEDEIAGKREMFHRMTTYKNTKEENRQEKSPSMKTSPAQIVVPPTRELSLH